MIIEELEKRNIPEVLVDLENNKINTIEQWEKHKKEIKRIICEEEYGLFPEGHANITTKIVEEDTRYCASSAVYRKIEITMHWKNKEYTFPVQSVISKLDNPCPAFIFLSFEEQIPNKYIPIEEICDNGFATFSIYYKAITSDDTNRQDGLAGVLNAEENDYGKIMIWAWAAMHVMDYVQTLPDIDKNNIAIVGHSRLGKTALLTGAFDERFSFVISNDSGQSGAALSRGKEGERIQDITDRFPYWFCRKYKEYQQKEELQPFDQHFLTALVAPRNLYIASAELDSWADPYSEYLTAVATDDVYKVYGIDGFIHPDCYPKVFDKFHNGNIGYHLRKGTHYIGRYDWQCFMEYMNKHKK